VRGRTRFTLQTLARLADGIIDAGALTIYEVNWHGAEHTCEPWRAYQRGKMTRALAAFEAVPLDPSRSDAVAIGLSCALEFLDRRQPLEWRPDCPRLAAWLSDFVRHEPAFERVHEHGADYKT
jgi:glutathione S-transferase